MKQRLIFVSLIMSASSWGMKLLNEKQRERKGEEELIHQWKWRISRASWGYADRDKNQYYCLVWKKLSWKFLFDHYTKDRNLLSEWTYELDENSIDNSKEIHLIIKIKWRYNNGRIEPKRLNNMSEQYGRTKPRPENYSKSENSGATKRSVITIMEELFWNTASLWPKIQRSTIRVQGYLRYARTNPTET